MKKIVVLCIGLLAFAAANAQQNDTALLRSLNVSEVKKYQCIHAFVGNIDTCLVEYQKLNTYGLNLFFLQYLGCSGYKQRDIVRATYVGRRMEGQSLERNNKMLVLYAFKYGKEQKQLARKTEVILSNLDTIQTEYTYYKKRRAKILDSTRLTLTNKKGSKTYVTKNTYDKKKRLLSVITVNSAGETLSETSHTWGTDGNIKSTINSSFGENISFVQTFFKYDQNDRVVETNDTHSRRNIYSYTDSGLLRNMLGYNAKGELEIEFIYKYTFTK
jgi:hypothetical protein